MLVGLITMPVQAFLDVGGRPLKLYIMEKRLLNLANNECIKLQLAFADVEEAIINKDYDKAMSLCRVWSDECRYSEIIVDYTLMGND